MNILRMEIVQQTNGKYALWNSEEQYFETHNRDTPEEIRDELLDRAGRILTSSMLSNAEDDSRFKMHVTDYRIRTGLDTTERDEAVAILQEMGESPSCTSDIPDSYRRVAWRGTLPVDPDTGELGISFDIPGGRTLRFRLSGEDGRKVAESIAGYLQEQCRDHSRMSSGISSKSVSTPEEGE